MERVEKPMLDVRDVFTTCISGYKYEGLLTEYIEQVVEETNNFQKKFLNKTAHEIEPKPIIFPQLEKDQEKLFVKVYKEKFVGSPGRKYYNMLMSLPKNGVCPLCGVRDVGSLDHYMPKAEFPILAVSPINLVAACVECNHTKSNDIFLTFEEATIHPYFDNIEDEVWLKTEIIDMDGIVFKYYVNREKPIPWSDVLYLRTKKHFNAFKLGGLFAKRAIREFEERKLQFQKIYIKGGTTALIEFLEEEIESRSQMRSKNHWQIGMLKALINSEWFLDEYIPNSIKEKNTCTK